MAMGGPTDSDQSADEARRRDADRERGTLDPGLKEQFERDHTVVRDHPSRTPEADALQRPHYEPPGDDDTGHREGDDAPWPEDDHPRP
jgi:hypothetical protein